MIVLAPALLLGFLTLPVLWWLVRATPPAPQDRNFPTLLFLRRLNPQREDAARSPLWLLLLRLGALALIIAGLSRPVLVAHQAAPASSSLTLILDDGWAAAPRWHERLRMALALGEAAIRSGGEVAVLQTARGEDGALPPAYVTRDASALSSHLRLLRPHPWPADRAAVADRLKDRPSLLRQPVVLLSDGVAGDSDFALRQVLAHAPEVRDMRWPSCPLYRLQARSDRDGTLRARVAQPPGCPAKSVTVRAVAQDGGTIANWPVQTGAEKTLSLPPFLRRSLDRLTLDVMPGPAGLVLLGQDAQRHPVGLLRVTGDNMPLVGSGFYLNHALSSVAELHSAEADALLSQPLSVLIAPDGALSGDRLSARVLDWVRHGGTLIRFAGPGLAAEPLSADDALLPVALMNGLRQLGGPMSWGKPQLLAQFPSRSPFAGLTIPREVTVSRQVLGRPGPELDDHVWASLQDGTPLVTARREGRGEIILFHVTASPDWSNLPLSGLFPQMLERLVARSAGEADSTAQDRLLPPWRILDMEGRLVPPSQAARPLPAGDDSVRVSALHPAGLYGPPHDAHALNLADHAPPLAAEPPLGTLVRAEQTSPDRPLAPWLTGAGMILLALDLLLSLHRRRLLTLSLTFLALFLSLPDGHAAGRNGVPSAALELRLGYILTGHAETDALSREGLLGLSDYVSQRSSVALSPPEGVRPGQDDLAFYPLLYWPITADARADQSQIAALNAYMKNGGILLIDEQGAGSELDGGSGRAVRSALRRATDGLSIPALMPLTDKHVLARTFYLLHSFPGRIAGQTVYVARHADEANDAVSPVIIGNGDWARAWAVDSSGGNPYAVIPGAEEQRVLAYRFGVNVVLYALTGNYKDDQLHYPEMLRRLGRPETDQASQDPDQTTDRNDEEEDAP